MSINRPINSIDQEKSSIPNTQIEDIFAHEQNTGTEKIENRPEQLVSEKQIEKTVEKEKIPEAVELKPDDSRKEDELSQRQSAPIQDQTQSISPVLKSMELIKIENILSENLDELFLQMTPQQQMAFKQKGEETATKISLLLLETKVKVKEIISLIKEWLRIIPGINKFFLEQEAKIKTDRLLNIREQKK